MITGTVVGGEALIERFESLPNRLRAELRVGIARACLLVQRETKESKLTGQVLNVRSGRLRRSINMRITEEPDQVTGIVGTNVSYARAHEFGFDGTVNVREHLRRTVSGKFAIVHSHGRHMHLPERSFLRSALKDMTAEIRAEFEQAAHRALTP